MRQMKVFDKVRIVIYRFHEKGLEVFLINPELDSDPQAWKLPVGSIQEKLRFEDQEFLDLGITEEQDGSQLKTLAIEADWHQIPSVRGIIKHDVKRVTNKIKKTIPKVEEGAYFCVKEAVKKVLPNEYKMLKELKDIMLDRNIVTNI